MAVNPTDFKSRYPEFEPVDDARVQLYLHDAQLEVQLQVWGSLYERGVFSLGAHFLCIANQTSSGEISPVGPVSSKSVGDVSVSFAISSPQSTTASSLNETRYGSEYMRLLSLVGITAIAVSDYGYS